MTENSNAYSNGSQSRNNITSISNHGGSVKIIQSGDKDPIKRSSQKRSPSIT